MNSQLGGGKPSWDRLCVCVGLFYPPPPPITGLVYGKNCPLCLSGMVCLLKLSSEQGFVSTQNRCCMDCDQLDWFSPIIIIINNSSPFINPE
jgi:hypothetical protein